MSAHMDSADAAEWLSCLADSIEHGGGIHEADRVNAVVRLRVFADQIERADAIGTRELERRHVKALRRIVSRYDDIQSDPRLPPHQNDRQGPSERGYHFRKTIRDAREALEILEMTDTAPAIGAAPDTELSPYRDPYAKVLPQDWRPTATATAPLPRPPDSRGARRPPRW